jgi:predicted  nucleic acid-binding Zn-ribbon protein
LSGQLSLALHDDPLVGRAGPAEDVDEADTEADADPDADPDAEADADADAEADAEAEPEAEADEELEVDAVQLNGVLTSNWYGLVQLHVSRFIWMFDYSDRRDVSVCSVFVGVFVGRS